jgi:nucleotide-binding universal stress UspA family protein
MFDRILVGLDGSAEGHRASRVALEIASRFHSRLTLVTVASPSAGATELFLQGFVPGGGETKALHHQLEEATEEAPSRGVASVEVVTLRGKVVEAILSYLRDHPHDLVVVGSRGLSRGGRLLMGSVSSQLVGSAPCPVLVVRLPSRTNRGGTSTPPSADLPPP